MIQGLPDIPAPKLLVAIIDRDNCSSLEDILREKRAHFHHMFNAMGTASSEVLKTFGLSGTEKTVCICVEHVLKIKSLMTSIVERMGMTRPGNGIAMVIPISGVSATISNAFIKEIEGNRERWAEYMEREPENTSHDARFELVVACVNHGYSETVMDAARASGARGGTIVHARHSAIEEAVRFFGVSLQAEKEIVAILISKGQKRDLMQSINKACGIKTEAHGIVISLPVQTCAGINEENENF